MDIHVAAGLFQARKLPSTDSMIGGMQSGAFPGAPLGTLVFSRGSLIS
tara:strand:+ start:178 stop:321 length:144 start_codon:yes stop_codon:yes gene_type:complete